MTVAKKAPAKKAGAPRKAAAAKAAPAKTEEVAEEQPVPFEAEEAEYRKPVRPTPSRFGKTPFAVVMLAWLPARFGEDPDAPADRDFEPFTDEAKAREFFKYQSEWAKEDFTGNGDIFHATILVSDTDPENLVFDQMEFWGPMAFESAAKKHFKENPTVIFSQTKRATVKAEGKTVAKKKAAAEPEVKPRTPNVKGKAALAKARADKAEAADADDASAEEVAGLPKGAGRGAALANLMKKKREQAEAAKADQAEEAKPAPKRRPRKAPAAKAEPEG